MHTISILGCGWLGLPLAEHLIQKGYNLKGSTTSVSKLSLMADKNINPFHIELPSERISTDFFESDYLILDIPPQTRSKGPDYHKKCVSSVLAGIREETKLIYISSTSVYPDENRKITEQDDLDKTSERAKALWQVEDLLKERLGERLTIVRMGGLLGYDRVPGKYFSGKKVQNGQQKVNYIHRDDAIGLIAQLLQTKTFGELFNGVAPLHPSRKEVFIANAEELGFAPPVFEDEENTQTDRFISGAKIKQKIDYSFIYPDPRRFYYTK